MAQPQWVSLPGFDSGFLDPEYHDNYAEDFRRGLREATNFIPTTAGAVRQRPKLEKTSVAWQSTWSDDAVYMIPIEDTNSTDSYCVVVYRSATLVPLADYEYNLVLVNLTDGTTTALSTPRATAGAYPVGVFDSSISPSVSHAQFGESTFIILAGFKALRLVNTAADTFTLEDVDWYRELPGVFHYGVKIDFSTVLTQIDPAPTSGLDRVDILPGDTLQISSGGSTIIGVVHKYTGVPYCTATDSGLGGSIWLKSCTSVDGTIVTPLTGAATIAKVGAAIYTSTISGSSACFMSENTPDDLLDDTASNESVVRVFGEDYTVTTNTITEFSFVVNETWDLGATENMTLAVKNTGNVGPYNAVAVAVYQGRLVLGGDSSTSSIQGQSRLYFSSSTDPLVVEPSPQLEPIPSSPIELDVIIGGEDQIQWLSGGDRLFIGGSRREYVEVNPQPISNTVDGLPRFTPVGDAGSNPATPFEVFDGRAFFAPKNGGAINMFQYNFDSARYQPQNLVLGSQSLFGSITHMAYRPPTSDDSLGRMLIRNDDDTLVFGSFQSMESRPAWTPVEYDDAFKIHALCAVKGEIYVVIERNSGGDMTVARFAFDDWTYTCDMQMDGSGSGTAWTVPAADQTTFPSGIYPAIGVITVDSQPHEIFLGYLTVAANAFTTPISVNSVKLGYKFDSKMVPLTAAAVDQLGSGQSRKRRIVRANIKLRDTSQVRVDGELLLQDYPIYMERELPPTTGVVEKVCTGWSYDPTIEFEGEIPYNATIVSINMKVAV